MIRLKAIPKTKSLEVTCDSCEATNIYEPEDVHIGLYGMDSIKCAQCGEDIFVNSEPRKIPPKFPTTFYHTNPESMYCLSDEEIQRYVDEVVAYLPELEDGEFVVAGTGDTMVYGFCYNDEYDIVVAKNTWEDTILRD